MAVKPERIIYHFIVYIEKTHNKNQPKINLLHITFLFLTLSH